MRRKFTVYGLRFSKTTFWNRLNTGFLEPAVATALTACGIETINQRINPLHFKLQRRLPLAVLKLSCFAGLLDAFLGMLQRRLPLAVLKPHASDIDCYNNSYKLQRRLPLAVLKHAIKDVPCFEVDVLQRRLPLAVLKLSF